MITFIISALKIVFLLGFLILIHESGHFFIAKLCKVKVNEFAIGFGPTIWKKQKKETKYALRLIPLGGFVSMEGEEERSENEGSFNKTSIPKRIAIVAAGGIVNIVFGLLVFLIVATSMQTNVSNKVDSLIPDYGAQIAGIQVGDEIVKIDNKKIRLKSDIDNILSQNTGNKLDIQIKRNDEMKNASIQPTKVDVKSTGIYFTGMNKDKKATQIVKLDTNSPAKKSGLQVNDIIIKINGIDVEKDQQKVIELINNSSEEMMFLVQREDSQIEVKLVPKSIPVYYLGINFAKAQNDLSSKIYYGFWSTTDFAGSILENLKMLFTGRVGIDQMMGPVGISSVVSNTKGITEFIYMLALISLSLGVTNLLPIPALDGGKIVILLIEWIRRKPLKETVEINLQMLGFALLIGLSIFITYKDILRIF